MKLTLAILLLSLLRCQAPVSFAGTVRLQGSAQFNQAAAAASGCTRSSGGVFANLTHYWKLEEGSGVARVDDVGGKTLTETVATPNGTGICGNAANFSSGTTRSMGTVDWTLAAPFSISFWIKVTDALVTPGDSRNILRKDDSSGDGSINCNLLFDGTFYNIDFRVGTIGDGFAGPQFTVLNTWHFVCVTVDAGGLGKYYIDGAQVDGGTCDATTSDQGLHLGNGSDGAVGGLIDELAIWSVELTAGNVTTLWNSSSGTFATP